MRKNVSMLLTVSLVIGLVSVGAVPAKAAGNALPAADGGTITLTEGVTGGTSETTFSPDSDCTRAQIVAFLFRTMEQG